MVGCALSRRVCSAQARAAQLAAADMHSGVTLAIKSLDNWDGRQRDAACAAVGAGAEVRRVQVAAWRARDALGRQVARVQIHAYHAEARLHADSSGALSRRVLGTLPALERAALVVEAAQADSRGRSDGRQHAKDDAYQHGQFLHCLERLSAESGVQFDVAPVVTKSCAFSSLACIRRGAGPAARYTHGLSLVRRTTTLDGPSLCRDTVGHRAYACAFHDSCWKPQATTYLPQAWIGG